MPLPAAVADLTAERRHPLQHLVDVGHDVVPIDEDPLAPRGPQGHVQHGAMLGDVDPLAGEHRRDPLAEAAGLGQPHQEAERLRRHPLLGVIEVQAAGVEHQSVTTTGVGCELVAEMRVSEGYRVRGKVPPRGQG